VVLNLICKYKTRLKVLGQEQSLFHQSIKDKKLTNIDSRIIMLREAKAIPQTRSSECDCGILKEISDGLQEVMDSSKGYQNCTVP
jgi:hypothetical protein